MQVGKDLDVKSSLKGFGKLFEFTVFYKMRKWTVPTVLLLLIILTILPNQCPHLRAIVEGVVVHLPGLFGDIKGLESNGVYCKGRQSCVRERGDSSSHRSGLELDVIVGISLLDMYAKCGSVEVACHLFDKLSIRDRVLWNVMIAGIARGYSFKFGGGRVFSYSGSPKVIEGARKETKFGEAMLMIVDLAGPSLLNLKEQHLEEQQAPKKEKENESEDEKEFLDDKHSRKHKREDFGSDTNMEKYGNIEDACNAFDKMIERNIEYNVAGRMENNERCSKRENC
eukprot:Gb_00450 [translate_table: standard]